jgi:hypothetical protein
MVPLKTEGAVLPQEGSRRPSSEGAGYPQRGEQGMPGARCARSLVCSVLVAHEVVTTVTPERPAFPAQWF